jgi:hypothetical protein
MHACGHAQHSALSGVVLGRPCRQRVGQAVSSGRVGTGMRQKSVRVTLPNTEGAHNLLFQLTFLNPLRNFEVAFSLPLSLPLSLPPSLLLHVSSHVRSGTGSQGNCGHLPCHHQADTTQS